MVNKDGNEKIIDDKELTAIGISDYKFYEDFNPKEIDHEFKYPELVGWEMIGFHRSIGKELWEFAFEMLWGIVWIFSVGYLIPLLAPYPEISGYQVSAGALFATVFLAFDIGTNFPFSRYIAEYRIKDPQIMIEYIRFFIWYQMLTGLTQVSVLSIVILYTMNTSQYLFLSWILLFIIIKQFPGMLGVFRQVIEGSQQFATSTALSWIQSFVVEYPLKIGFVLLGRWYGETHPEMGILLGMAVGTVIGIYIDDFIFLFINGYYFNKMIKPFGFTFKDAWIPKVRKNIFKKAFFYGTQSTIIPLIGSFVGTWIFILTVSNIPGYYTWTALYAIGAGFTGMMWNIGFPLDPVIAESYSNNKKELAEFCISSYIKWKYFFLILLASIIGGLLPFFAMTIDNYSGLRFYKLSLYFVIPALINNLIMPILEIPNRILYGAGKITVANIFNLIAIPVGFLNAYLNLFVFQFQYKGLWGIVYIFAFGGLLPSLLMNGLRFIYVQKKLLKIRIFPITSILIPTLVTLPIFFITSWYIRDIWPILQAVLGYGLTMVISFILVMVVMFFLYFFPMTGISGMWDDYQLYVFEKAIHISGPSRFFFKPAFKLMKKGVKISRKLGIYGKRAIPWKVAHQQIDELMFIKMNQIKKAKEEN